MTSQTALVKFNGSTSQLITLKYGVKKQGLLLELALKNVTAIDNQLDYIDYLSTEHTPEIDARLYSEVLSAWLQVHFILSFYAKFQSPKKPKNSYFIRNISNDIELYLATSYITDNYGNFSINEHGSVSGTTHNKNLYESVSITTIFNSKNEFVSCIVAIDGIVIVTQYQMTVYEFLTVL